jgi:hypothetical protein
MALDPLGFDDALPAAEPTEQLPDIGMIAAASVCNAESLRDERVTAARAAHDANECLLAFIGLGDSAVNDPRYAPAQMLNMAVGRWCRHFGRERGELWRDVVIALIRLARKTALGRG